MTPTWPAASSTSVGQYTCVGSGYVQLGLYKSISPNACIIFVDLKFEIVLFKPAQLVKTFLFFTQASVHKERGASCGRLPDPAAE